MKQGTLSIHIEVTRNLEALLTTASDALLTYLLQERQQTILWASRRLAGVSENGTSGGKVHIKVSNNAGYLCHVSSEAIFPASPSLVYGILTNPGGCTYISCCPGHRPVLCCEIVHFTSLLYRNAYLYGSVARGVSLSAISILKSDLYVAGSRTRVVMSNLHLLIILQIILAYSATLRRLGIGKFSRMIQRATRSSR